VRDCEGLGRKTPLYTLYTQRETLKTVKYPVKIKGTQSGHRVEKNCEVPIEDWRKTVKYPVKIGEKL
jgi:hypothetical protein